MDSLSTASAIRAQCVDRRGLAVHDNHWFYPHKNTPCLRCLCQGGSAVQCRKEQCTVPPCVYRPIPDECCKFDCLAGGTVHAHFTTSTARPVVGNDDSLLSMKLVGCTISVLLVIGLLLAVFYRLRQRIVLSIVNRLQNNAALNVASCSNRGESPWHDPPPPYSPPKLPEYQPPPPSYRSQPPSELGDDAPNTDVTCSQPANQLAETVVESVDESVVCICYDSEEEARDSQQRQEPTDRPWCTPSSAELHLDMMGVSTCESDSSVLEEQRRRRRRRPPHSAVADVYRVSSRPARRHNLTRQYKQYGFIDIPETSDTDSTNESRLQVMSSSAAGHGLEITKL